MSDSADIDSLPLIGAKVQVMRRLPLPEKIVKRSIPFDITAYTTCHETIRVLQNIIKTAPVGTTHAVDHFQTLVPIYNERGLNKSRIEMWFPQDEEFQKAEEIGKSASTWMKCGHTDCSMSNGTEGRVSCQLLFRINDEAMRRNLAVHSLPTLPESPYIEEGVEETV